LCSRLKWRTKEIIQKNIRSETKHIYYPFVYALLALKAGKPKGAGCVTHTLGRAVLIQLDISIFTFSIYIYI
jgi:hypothetical protein